MKGNAAGVPHIRRMRLPWYAPLPLLPLVLIVAVLLWPALTPSLDDSVVEGGSCETVASRTAYLIDLRKPLDADHRSLPGDLLERLSIEAPAHAELAVYALSPYAEAPRTLIGQLCKPYGNGELLLATQQDFPPKIHQSTSPLSTPNADHAAQDEAPVADCDDLAGQLRNSLRTSALRFCEERALVRRRIDALVDQMADGPVVNAYLVEALDETTREFTDTDVPASLYVFSDMMQHAKWYSHLDLGWRGWDLGAFEAAQDAAALAQPVRPSRDAFPVTVFYVPRNGITGRDRQQLIHKGFWEGFFEDAALAFEDQPLMSAYAAEPLMPVMGDVELAAYEREQARYRAMLVEQEQAALTVSRHELERDRLDLARDRQQIAEQQRLLGERLAEAELVEARMGLADETESGEEVATDSDGPGIADPGDLSARPPDAEPNS